MLYETLLVLMVISCLDAVVNEEETASSSTLDLILQAQCEAQCYSVSPVVHYIIKYVVAE
jgi:hypothetical protein